MRRRGSFQSTSTLPGLACSPPKTDEEQTDRAAVVRALLEGQFNGPVRVIAFNTAAGWSRDVSEEIADELTRSQVEDIPVGLQDFIQLQASGRPAQLPLPLRPLAN